MNKAFLCLLITSFVSTFSAGLFWTGFPVFLNDFGHGDLGLSKIYAYATFGSLVFSLVGGILSDIGNSKKISIISQFISVLIIAVVFLKIGDWGVKTIVYMLPIIYFNFSIANISELVWLLKFEDTSTVKNKILDRALLAFLAKLSGFSLGPLLFAKANASSLLVCAGLFLLSATLQIFLPHPIADVEARAPLKSTFSAIFDLLKKPIFVGAAFLTGMLSIPLNPLFVTQVLKVGSVQSVSVFWVLAGFAGLINIFFQRMGWIELSARKLWLSTAVLVLAIAVSFTASQLSILLLFSALYVFGSVLFSMHLHISLGTTAVKSKLGSSFGFLNLVIDAGIFIGMAAGSLAQTVSSGTLISTLCVLLILRAFFVRAFI